MAGETVKAEAVCLRIVPWSRTSHIVQWLTPTGKVTTVVKGAVRPKSFFLGQYDLNYTCEIVYYARGRGELHALRECTPLVFRDGLRGDYRALALAGHFRRLASDFAPTGPDCAAWHESLADALDRLCLRARTPAEAIGELLRFELAVLGLLGLQPELEAESGAFALRGERRMPVDSEVAAYLRDPTRPVKNMRTPLDAARVIGVFYQFHLDCASDVRRTVLGMISKPKRRV
jgi:recombinational DNA repair protein (RecF pathway)